MSLDDASDTTFIKSSVKEALGVQGVDTALILSTMLGREEIQVSRVDGLVVERLHRKVQVQLPRAYTRGPSFHRDDTRYLDQKYLKRGRISEKLRTKLHPTEVTWKSVC